MKRLTAALAVALVASPAVAASFATIGTVPGGPQIGAVAGGRLYGTVAYSGNGELFTMPVAGGAATVIYQFDGTVSGKQPDARLAVAPGGAIIGATTGGGAHGGGTLWVYNPVTAKLRVAHAFGAGTDGTAPMQGPSMGPGGVVFGATGEGAIGGSGNIFSLSGQRTYAVLYQFMSQGDGHCPFSGVAIGAGGVLYGTTVGVGFGGNPTGSVWQFTPGGALKTLYVFQDGADGEWPTQAPVVDAQGNLYGTTSTQGGASFAGAIWKITAAGTFSILHAMTGAQDGFAPNSPLLLSTDGMLYGTTAAGGAANAGTVFSISRRGAFSVIHSFTAGSDGAQPTGNLLRGAGGVIYGGTAYGPVFSITP